MSGSFSSIYVLLISKSMVIPEQFIKSDKYIWIRDINGAFFDLFDSIIYVILLLTPKMYICVEKKIKKIYKLST